MSITVLARVFWTDIPTLRYKNELGKNLSVSPRTAKIMLLAIADSADDFGENSYNSYETLKKKTSLQQRRSAIRVCNALQENGYIQQKGVSKYGTNNFSVNLDKLGTIPTQRAKTGRPVKSGDSGAKSGDSGAKSGDSGAESGDSESPDSSFNRPLTSNEEGGEKFDFGMTYTFFLENFGAPRQYDEELLMDMCDEHTPYWTIEAMKIAVKNNARNLAYVDAVLKRWKAQGYGTERQNGKGRSNGKNLTNSQAPAPDNYVEELEKKRVRLRKQMENGGKVQLPS